MRRTDTLLLSILLGVPAFGAAFGVTTMGGVLVVAISSNHPWQEQILGAVVFSLIYGTIAAFAASIVALLITPVQAVAVRLAPSARPIRSLLVGTVTGVAVCLVLTAGGVHVINTLGLTPIDMETLGDTVTQRHRLRLVDIWWPTVAFAFTSSLASAATMIQWGGRRKSTTTPPNGPTLTWASGTTKLRDRHE